MTMFGAISYGLPAAMFALLAILLLTSWKGRLQGALLVAAYLVTASATAVNLADLLAISGVVVAFALVIFITHWFSPPLANQLGPQGRDVLNRVGGIVLVAISVDLFTTGLRNLLPGLAD